MFCDLLQCWLIWQPHGCEVHELTIEQYNGDGFQDGQSWCELDTKSHDVQFYHTKVVQS